MLLKKARSAEKRHRGHSGVNVILNVAEALALTLGLMSLFVRRIGQDKAGTADGAAKLHTSVTFVS